MFCRMAPIRRKSAPELRAPIRQVGAQTIEGSRLVDVIERGLFTRLGQLFLVGFYDSKMAFDPGS